MKVKILNIIGVVALLLSSVSVLGLIFGNSTLHTMFNDMFFTSSILWLTTTQNLQRIRIKSLEEQLNVRS